MMIRRTLSDEETVATTSLAYCARALRRHVEVTVEVVKILCQTDTLAAGGRGGRMFTYTWLAVDVMQRLLDDAWSADRGSKH